MELIETRTRLNAIVRELAKVHIGEDKLNAVHKAVAELATILLHTLPSAPPAPPSHFKEPTEEPADA